MWIVTNFFTLSQCGSISLFFNETGAYQKKSLKENKNKFRNFLFQNKWNELVQISNQLKTIAKIPIHIPIALLPFIISYSRGTLYIESIFFNSVWTTGLVHSEQNINLKKVGHSILIYQTPRYNLTYTKLFVTVQKRFRNCFLYTWCKMSRDIWII